MVLPDYQLHNRDLNIMIHDGATMSAKVRTIVDYAVRQYASGEYNLSGEALCRRIVSTKN